MKPAGDSPLAIALILLLHCSAVSLMAVGGGVVVLTPELERLVVSVHGWMTTRTFIEDYTLAQAAPGPNLLFVTLIGLQAAGPLGALAATFGIIVPPAGLLLGALEFRRRHPELPRWPGLREALAPLSVGLMLASGASLARMAVDTWPGALLLAVTVLVTLRSRLNPLWLIALGALCGIAGWV